MRRTAAMPRRVQKAHNLANSHGKSTSSKRSESCLPSMQAIIWFGYMATAAFGQAVQRPASKASQRWRLCHQWQSFKSFGSVANLVAILV